MQQKHRSIFIIPTIVGVVLGLVALAASPAAAAGPYGNASRAERLGCQTASYHGGADYDLRGPHGAKRGDIGAVLFYVRPSPSRPGDERLCALTKHGHRTYGKTRYTSIEVGTVPKRGGTQSLRYRDAGNFKKFSSGRAITPSKGRCVVIHGVEKHARKTFQIWIRTSVCN